MRHYEHRARPRVEAAARRADAERVLEDLRSLCRAAQAFEEQHEHATLTGFLEHAAGLHAQEVDARDRPADHRLDDPPGQGRGGAAGRAARLRGAAPALVALARPRRIPARSRRSAACSTSPPPAPRTGC